MTWSAGEARHRAATTSCGTARGPCAPPGSAVPPGATATRLDGSCSYDGPVLQLSAPDEAPEREVVRLSPAGRVVRLAVTAAVLVVIAIGSAWGSDADFPFGPWKMYSTRADPDQPVVSTRVVGLTAAGDEVKLSGGEVGLRRAEFEGQLPRIESDPELLGLLAESYADAHPDAPELESVAVIQRNYELDAGVRTGEYTDRVIVDFPLDGAG